LKYPHRSSREFTEFFHLNWLHSLRRLEKQRDGFTYLLPKLRSLGWTVTFDQDILGLCDFIAPTIQVLHVSFTANACGLHIAEFDPLVYILEETGVNLVELHMYLNGRMGEEVPFMLSLALSRILRLCPGISTLGTNTSVFSHLNPFITPIPSLKCINLQGQSLRGQSEDESFPLSNLNFPLLSEINGDSIAFWIGFIRAFGSTIDDITLSPMNTSNDPNFDPRDLTTAITEFAELIEVIGRNCSKLENIAWKYVQPFGYLTNPVEILRPLTRCSQLTTLQIIFSGTGHPMYSMDLCQALSNRELADLSTAWPLLEGLVICGDNRCPVKSPLTLDCLPVLKKNCPRLRTVGLTIDTTVQPSDTPLNFTPAFEEINFCLSQLDSPVTLAVRLGNACQPEGLQWHEDDDDPLPTQAWRHTRDFLAYILSASKKDETSKKDPREGIEFEEAQRLTVRRSSVLLGEPSSP
jgi:hypothetical protein